MLCMSLPLQEFVSRITRRGFFLKTSFPTLGTRGLFSRVTGASSAAGRHVFGLWREETSGETGNRV